MFFCLLLGLLGTAAAASSHITSIDCPQNAPQIRTLYEYPKVLNAWPENIVQRPNGELLITRLDAPAVVELLNPFDVKPAPKTLYTFPQANATSGIAQIAPDAYAIAVGNFSFRSGGVPDTWTVWTFDLSSEVPRFRKLADIPGSAHINGMTYLPDAPNAGGVLIGDDMAGVIYRVDITTSKVTLAVNNTYTAPIKDPNYGAVGVNGIHVRDSMLYYVNLSIFVKMLIHPDGTPAGEPVIITRRKEPTNILNFDDFTLRGDKAYLVTSSGNSILQVDLDGKGDGVIIAGGLNSTAIAEPTVCILGRTPKDMDTLYLLTGGGALAPINGSITVNPQVLAIDLK
jgi:hypothetical protein